ncbi:MAG: (2Fe-2S)-binding protein [Gammaproteobacteria bacterium]|jgi:isoquinoline 1-oxidoreductase alpha subunit|nr:(2Fe-2S)-binding protein [Gammaproteobacteria bacterium]
MTELSINGVKKTHDGDPAMPLLWFIRDEVGLTGTKFGCGIAQCGACTVHLDGNPIRACVTPVAAAAGKNVVTIENAVTDKVGAAVQASWRKLDVVQCGYCQSGQMMSAVALLARNKTPNDEDIDAAMSGNVCRCATYVRIRAAIHDAAKALA